MNNYIVYMHETPNGKKYIGITGQSVERRWGNGSGYKQCVKFNRAIKKYGWKNITHTILFSGISKEEAERKEVELIKKYNTTASECGYNIENGGSTIGKHSAETKEKIGNANRGRRSPYVGRPRSEETKKKIADATKGKPKSGTPWNKGKTLPPPWNKGKHFSADAREKMSAAKIGKPSLIKKGIYQYTRGGELVKEYDSLTAAGQGISGDIRNISAVCLGKKKTAYGFVWRYKGVV